MFSRDDGTNLVARRQDLLLVVGNVGARSNQDGVRDADRRGDRGQDGGQGDQGPELIAWRAFTLPRARLERRRYGDEFDDQARAGYLEVRAFGPTFDAE